MRKHYDEVVLYTDSAGKDALINRLGLPYTEIHVVFDDFPCLSHHWALAKIKTYSMQTAPFLHIDADVFAPQPFPDRLLHAPLAVQNAEQGTHYYREMLDRMLAHGEFQFPEFVRSRIGETSLPSYNMGIFGGTDLNFIHRYCQAVTDFVVENRLNDPCDPRAAANCNVFIEQIFFAMMVLEEQRTVESLIGRKIDDNGYTIREFCNLKEFERQPYFHLLGGHKCNEIVCDQMTRQLMMQYPEYYLRLKTLFHESNHRMAEHIASDTERAINDFRDYLTSQEIRWRHLLPEDILRCERAAAMGLQLLEFEQMTEKYLEANPNLSFYDVPQDWPSKAIEWLRKKVHAREDHPIRRVAIVPTLGRRGIHEVCISPLASNILLLLQDRSLTYESLTANLAPCFSLSLRTSNERVMRMIRYEVAYLMYHVLVLPVSYK